MSASVSQTAVGYEEHYLAVMRAPDRLFPLGWVARSAAHSPLRVLHTTTILVLIVGHDVVLHRRSARKFTSPGKLDFLGGHVPFEVGAMAGPEAVETCICRTALREAREEILAARGGAPVLIPEAALVRFTPFGALEADEPINREASTGFAIKLPASADLCVAVYDEESDGTTAELPLEVLPLDEVVRRFVADPDDFADGAARLLRILTATPAAPISRDLRRIIDQP